MTIILNKNNNRAALKTQRLTADTFTVPNCPAPQTQGRALKFYKGDPSLR